MGFLMQISFSVQCKKSGEKPMVDFDEEKCVERTQCIMKPPSITTGEVTLQVENWEGSAENGDFLT